MKDSDNHSAAENPLSSPCIRSHEEDCRRWLCCCVRDVGCFFLLLPNLYTVNTSEVWDFLSTSMKWCLVGRVCCKMSYRSYIFYAHEAFSCVCLGFLPSPKHVSRWIAYSTLPLGVCLFPFPAGGVGSLRWTDESFQAMYLKRPPNQVNIVLFHSKVETLH